MVAFSNGDIVIGGNKGWVEVIRTSGQFVQHIAQRDDINNNMVVNGITFRGNGELFTALGSPDGNHFPEPHDVVWIPDDSGVLAIIATSATTAQLWKYNFNHIIVQKSPNISLDSGWTYRKKMKLDIDCDADTVYYTDGMKTIFKYKFSTSTQLSNFKQLDSASPYVYSAFKLTPANGLLVDATATGLGPHSALCLDADGSSLWTDLLNETTDFHAFKRRMTDGTQILNHIVSLDASNLSDHSIPVISLGSYYHYCVVFTGGILVFSQVVS